MRLKFYDLCPQGIKYCSIMVLHNNVYLVEVIPFPIFSIVYPLRGTNYLQFLFFYNTLTATRYLS